MRNGRIIAGRIVLTAVTLWGLLMIVPDFHRVIEPLASTGFAANNDGWIYDVTDPFAPGESPAWQAGLRRGDRLDLRAMACSTAESRGCMDLLAVLGGMGGRQLVRPGRVLRLHLVPADGGAVRAVDVAARPTPVANTPQASRLAPSDATVPTRAARQRRHTAQHDDRGGFPACFDRGDTWRHTTITCATRSKRSTSCDDRIL